MQTATQRPSGLLVLLAAMVIACTPATTSSVDYLDDYPALTDAGDVNVVVEIPAGTNAKWEVDHDSGALEWEIENGAPRVVDYLAYPANYGMVPRTLLPSEVGGDGDPLDVILLGTRVERGSVVATRPIGILRLIDRGERDDKILAVQTTGPLAQVVDLATLDASYPGARTIIETWFTHYKGADALASNGFGDAAEARDVIAQASRHYVQAGGRTSSSPRRTPPR